MDEKKSPVAGVLVLTGGVYELNDPVGAGAGAGVGDGWVGCVGCGGCVVGGCHGPVGCDHGGVGGGIVNGPWPGVTPVGFCGGTGGGCHVGPAPVLGFEN